MKRGTENLRYQTIRKIILHIVNDRKASLRDCLIVYLYYAYHLSPKTLSQLRHTHVDSQRGALFDPEKKVTMLLPRPWAQRLRAYFRMSDKGAPALFYARTKTANFALSPQAVMNVVRTATRAALDTTEYGDIPQVLKESSSSLTVSSYHETLRTLYKQRHPRAQ